MIIGTTPTLTFQLKYNSDANLSTAQNIYITFKQGLEVLTKTGNDLNIVDSKTVKVTLTQAETLEFSIDKKVEVQMNWTYLENNVLMRAATKVATISLDKQLKPEVIS